MNLTPEEQWHIIDTLWSIIKTMGSFIVGLLALGTAVFAFFHKGLLRRLDAIDADLKPISKQVAIQEKDLESVHETLKEHNETLKEHHKRLTELEKKP